MPNGRPRRHLGSKSREKATENSAMGWCADEDGLDVAKQSTHDILLRLLGDSRSGGVWWMVETGTAADDLVSKFIAASWEDGGDLAELTHYRQIKAYLREHGGWVVVAVAPAVVPIGRFDSSTRTGG